MIPAPDTLPEAAAVEPVSPAAAGRAMPDQPGAPAGAQDAARPDGSGPQGVTLITCHANADFDAFAAMLAARFLYEPHVLLFPCTQERGLQKLVAGLECKALGIAETAAIPWQAINRLVVVDTRQRGRISHVAQLLDRPDVAVELWDHHPDTADDITTPHTHLAHIGSVTSLIVQTIADRGLSLSADDATLLGLGIYSDTGSFTYSSTTQADFQSAAWLLGQGMDLNRVDALAAH